MLAPASSILECREQNVAAVQVNWRPPVDAKLIKLLRKCDETGLSAKIVKQISGSTMRFWMRTLFGSQLGLQEK